jgi:putative transposase
LPKSLHASVRRALRQAWELNDADQAEKLIRNLARRLERDWSGVAGSLLEGIEEILTVTRLGLPKELRRSLACTNIVENLMGTVRRVCRNVRWRSASMAMRWTAVAMQEAAKGFRRLKAHKQLPALRVRRGLGVGAALRPLGRSHDALDHHGRDAREHGLGHRGCQDVGDRT